MSNAQINAIRALLASNPVFKPGSSLQMMRASLDVMGQMGKSLPEVRTMPVDADGVECFWLEATSGGDAPIILYLHGGGYVMGSALSHRALIERLTLASGGKLLAVNYRLAPEHPFPAAPDDALSTYRWLLAQGYSAKKIAIIGDSAGGGLALSTLVAIRDCGLELPSSASLISPWVDMQASGDSMVNKASADPLVQKAMLLQLAPMYLNGADSRTPLASPLYAELHGLPPILIQVGSAETLLDDSNRLAKKLVLSDSPVTLEVWEDMIHVWHLFASRLDKGQEAIERLAQFTCRSLQ